MQLDELLKQIVSTAESVVAVTGASERKAATMAFFGNPTLAAPVPTSEKGSALLDVRLGGSLKTSNRKGR